MATLQIRKKAEKVFVHIPSDQAEFIISKFYISIDGLEFQVVEQGQSKRNKYLLSDITVYDDTVGGSAETFTTIEELSERLVALKYNGFYNENESLFNAFTDLVDTPSSYTGQGGKVVAVKSDASGLEFITGGGGGSTPTLQDVLDEGNTADESIILTDGIDTTTINKGSIDLQFDDTLGSGDNFVIQRNAVGETLFSNLETGKSVLMRIAIPTGNGELNYPDVGNNIETIATREWVEDNVEQIIRSKSNGTFGSHTGNTAETVILSIDINANEFEAGDWMTLLFSLEKDATVGNVTWRLRAGVNGNTSDNQIATVVGTAANSRYVALYRGRPQFLTGNQLRIWGFTQGANTDISSAGAPGLVSLTPTSAWKLTVTAQLTVTTETASLTGYRIGKIKSF